MVELSIDGTAYFLVVAIIIQLHDLQIVLLVFLVLIVLEISIGVLVVDHLDLVVEQSHCLYFVLELETVLLLALSLGVSQVGYQNVE